MEMWEWHQRGGGLPWGQEAEITSNLQQVKGVVRVSCEPGRFPWIWIGNSPHVKYHVFFWGGRGILYWIILGRLVLGILEKFVLNIWKQWGYCPQNPRQRGAGKHGTEPLGSSILIIFSSFHSWASLYISEDTRLAEWLKVNDNYNHFLWFSRN